MGNTEATHARHSRHFAESMRRHEAALKQPQQLEAMQAIDRDFDNFRLAWEWAVEQRQAANLHMMLNPLYLFGFLGSRHVETIMIFQQTLAQPIADVPLLGRLLARRWGSLHWWFQADSDYREALTSIEQALAIAQSHGNGRWSTVCAPSCKQPSMVMCIKPIGSEVKHSAWRAS